jgi:hypothetical protein
MHRELLSRIILGSKIDLLIIIYSLESQYKSSHPGFS